MAQQPRKKGLGVTFMKQGIKGPMATKEGMKGSLKQYKLETKSTNIVPKAKPTPPTQKSAPRDDRMPPAKTTSVPPQIGSGGRVMGSKAEAAGKMAIERRQSAPPAKKPSTKAPQIGSGGRVMGSKAEKAGRMTIERRKEANKKLVRESINPVVATGIAAMGGAALVGLYNMLKGAPKVQQPNTKPKKEKDWTSGLDGPMSGRFRQAPRTKVRGGVKPGSKKKKPFTVENDPWQY